MTVLIAAILISVLVATYLSALNLSLLRMSRAALQRRLDERGRRADADWLFDQLEDAVLGTAFLRTVMRISTYIFTLAALIGLGRSATVTWGDLVISGAAAAVVIWLTTIVLGTTIARHCGPDLLAANLRVLWWLTAITRPVSRAGAVVGRLLGRMIGVSAREQAGAELLESIEDVQYEGALDVQSAEILENVVEFTNTEVSQVMTPRLEIEGIEYTDDLAAIRSFIFHAGHSRIPVYRGTVDNIVGILYLKDLIRYLGEEAPDFRLTPLLRQPIVVPETKPVRELLSVFQRSKVHMAIVVDEYGSTAGLVTIEDVLEEIVGDIQDEHEPLDEGEPEFRSIDEMRVEVDGRYRVHELNERLDLRLPENGDFDTIAGFMLWHFGRVPSAGEAFETQRARFTAISASPTHVERVGIELLPYAPQEDGAGSGQAASQAAAAGKWSDVK